VNCDVRILNLQKQYKKYIIFDSVFALKGMSLTLQKNEVFALLGHNGAGKTTAISCMTGAIRPTGGDAIVLGLSLKRALPQIQKRTGVCPQHSVLFEELTAREHLELFCSIKLVPPGQAQVDMIEARLKDVLLLDVADKKAGEFSGGMKRRLSVAMSAIGDPEIIYLDEPTTGLDPSSRRHIWNAIQRLKKGRVIILTTHSMEEADILGDRIGVMAAGKLKCLGTSLHLKNKFGRGYRISVLCESKEHLPAVRAYIANLLPTATQLSTFEESIVYEVSRENFDAASLFARLDAEKASVGIKEYGISQTSLEDVFVNIVGNIDT